MKKIFLFALTVAGATASFGQTSTSNQPVTKNNTAPTYSEAQATAKAKKETKDMPPSTNTKATKTTKTSDKQQAK